MWLAHVVNAKDGRFAAMDESLVITARNDVPEFVYMKLVYTLVFVPPLTVVIEVTTTLRPITCLKVPVAGILGVILRPLSHGMYRTI